MLDFGVCARFHFLHVLRMRSAYLPSPNTTFRLTDRLVSPGGAKVSTSVLAPPVVIAAIGILGCKPQRGRSVPDELVGVAFAAPRVDSLRPERVEVRLQAQFEFLVVARTSGSPGDFRQRKQAR